MKVKNNRARAFVALAAVAVLGTTGCSAINEHATAMDYAPSDGVSADVGDLEVRNLALVSNEPNDAGRFIGTLNSASGENVNATLTVGGETFSFNVSGNEPLVLEDAENETVVANTGSAPGELVDVEVSVGSDSSDVATTVLPGTLEEYRDFVPQESFDPEQQTEHLREYEGHHAPDNEH